MNFWKKCLDCLQDELSSQQFNTWIRPLKAIGDECDICLLAPNRFVADWVRDKFLSRIEEIIEELADFEEQQAPALALTVSSRKPKALRKIASIKDNNNDVTENSSKDIPFQLEKKSIRTKNDERLLDFNQNKEVNLIKDEKKSLNLQKNSHIKNVYQLVSQQYFSFTQPQVHFNNDIISINTNPQENKKDLVDIEQYTRIDKVLNNDDLSYDIQNSKNNDNNKNNNALLRSKDNTSQVSSNDRMDNESKEDSHVSVKSNHNHAKKTTTNKNFNSLNKLFSFDSFVEGKSNQLALSAAQRVSENPGVIYNPLFLYGGVGLGKTHLMHAAGNQMVKNNPGIKVAYLHSERFVADMVKALQLNAISDFKRYYRSVDALLIDDIQFFSGKDRSQEEFFYTLNALLEGGQQVILTCDRYPKEITGLQERLKSRFGWGLIVGVEPPELETRVAILKNKAKQQGISLPDDSAFFIAHRVRSNVRELEGVLKKVVASAYFFGRDIDIPLIRESLKDLLALQYKQICIENIQKTIADFYQIKVVDLLSKKRMRSLARPRQIAMALAKELTTHSLPEIGEAFGGRDHTTVLYACRKVKELTERDSSINSEYKNFLKLFTH